VKHSSKIKKSSLLGEWADKLLKLHECRRKSYYKSTTLHCKYLQPSRPVELSLHSSWLHGDDLE